MPLVFSYGSNSLAQLSGRVLAPGEPALRPPQPAVLRDYARVFCGDSQGWDGAVCDVQRQPGHCVLGAVTSLKEEQLRRLDAFEGAYQLTSVTVELRGEALEAVAYTHVSPSSRRPPSEAYLCAVAFMLEESHGPAAAFPVLRRQSDGSLGHWNDAGSCDEWRRPQASRLQTVLALCYVAGAEARPPWTLPAAAAAATAAFAAEGVSDGPALRELLRSCSADDPRLAPLRPGGALGALRIALSLDPLAAAPAEESAV